MSRWHERLYAYLWVCLEMDMLKGRKLEKIVVKPAANDAASAGDEGVAPLRALTEDQKILRAACQNSMVVTVMALSSPENQPRQKAIVSVCGPVDKWHSEQNEQLRDVNSTVRWMQRQLNQDFMGHLNEIWACVKNRDTAEFVGLTMRWREGLAGVVDDGNCHQVNVDCELAAVVGDLAVSLVGQRLRRHMWMLRGWPNRCCLMLQWQPEGFSRRDTSQLKQDYDNWERLKSEENAGPCSFLLERSIFSLRCVEQVVGMMKLDRWEMGLHTNEVLLRKAQRLVQTQVVEDGFNRMRRVEQKKHNRVSRTSELYKCLVERKVLNVVHHFETIKPREARLTAAPRLPANAYQPKADIWPRLKEIIGYNQKTSWWSGGPGGHHLPYCDLELAKFVCERNLENIADRAWLGCLLHSERLMVRSVAPDGGRGQWMLSFGNCGGSAAICWPMEAVAMPGVDFVRCYLPVKVDKFDELPWVTVVDEEAWETMPFAWQPMLKLWSLYPELRGSRFSGIFALPTAAPAPMVVTAARGAFWDLPRVTLARLAKHLQLPCDEHEPIFDFCFNMVKQILGVSDKEALEIMSSRLARTAQAQNAGVDAFLQIDEMCNMLNQEDRREITSEKAELKKKQEVHAEFKSAYKKKRLAVSGKPAKLKVQTRQQLAKKSPPAGSGQRVYMKELPPADFEQWELKHLVLEGGSLWRCNVQGAWACHFPPFPRRSFAHRLYGGERACVVLCLRELWDRFLDQTGRERSDCPIGNLWAEDFAPLG